MSIRISSKYLIFTTRPFVFACTYEEMLKRLILKSKSYDNSDEKITSLTEDFIKQFLNPNELLIERSVLRYNDSKSFGESSLKNALKNEHVLFMLDKENYIKDLRKDCLPKMVDSFKEVLRVFKENNKALATKISLNEFEIIQLISSSEEIISSNELTIEKFRDEVLAFNQSIKNLRNKLFKSDTKSEYNRKFGDKLKELHKIIDVVDGLMCCDDKTHIFAFVSAAGTIQISIVKESYINSEIKSDKKLLFNKSLITEADRITDIITAKINKLPKIFSIIDLNRYFGFTTQDKPMIAIFDHPRRLIRKYDLLDFKEVNSLYGKTSPQKALYLRMNVISVDKNFKNISIDFFNYVSLLVAYNHSFDKFTLLEYCVENSKYGSLHQNDETKKIKDHVKKTTEHLYINDSLAVL